MKYQRLDGVHSAIVGYTGGSEPNPTYDEIMDHTEAILVEFDPQETSYTTLLQEWTKMHKPIEAVVNQYRSVVWYLNDEQRSRAEKVVEEWKCRVPGLHTAVEKATTFYRAESYHQDYYLRTGQARFIR